MKEYYHNIEIAYHNASINKDLVSIVVPVYNAGRFLDDTIKTVLNQTYANWELILVNDKSTDNSREIALKYQEKDHRIKLLDNKNNSGAAISRNKGIDEAKGKFIAFLDADDLWNKDKLKKQVKFMNEKDCEFSFTGYEFADENGKPNGKKVYVPATINYKQALKNTTIWTSTVMANLTKINKKDLLMQNIKYEDSACWWHILNNIKNGFGLNEILSYYRRSKKTYSANKLNSMYWTWKLYRKVENLTILTSIFYLLINKINALKRRI